MDFRPGRHGSRKTSLRSIGRCQGSIFGRRACAEASGKRPQGLRIRPQTDLRRAFEGGKGRSARAAARRPLRRRGPDDGARHDDVPPHREELLRLQDAEHPRRAGPVGTRPIAERGTRASAKVSPLRRRLRRRPLGSRGLDDRPSRFRAGSRAANTRSCRFIDHHRRQQTVD